MKQLSDQNTNKKTHTHIGEKRGKNQEEMGVEGKVVIDDMREELFIKKK